LPESIRPLFVAAGWYPGWRAWFTRFAGLKKLASFPLGSTLVREFGGLRVGRSVPGLQRCASDLAFYRRPTAGGRIQTLRSTASVGSIIECSSSSEMRMESSKRAS
jgi:hypothetical protein